MQNIVFLIPSLLILIWIFNVFEDVFQKSINFSNGNMGI